MGADYIPEDNILARVSPERTRSLLEDCVRANYNCVRVWGGGYYPDDFFFDICDELGLIVWEDFMFACATYRMTKKFEENLVPEFIENIKRLRNHASLACCAATTKWRPHGLTGIFRRTNAQSSIISIFMSSFCRISVRNTRRIRFIGLPAPPQAAASTIRRMKTAVTCTAGRYGTRKAVYLFSFTYFRFCSEFGFESFPDSKTCRSFAEG